MTFQPYPLSHSQQLLLKATFSTETVAVKAFHQWTDKTDFEDLEWDSHQLLPTLYNNLVRYGVKSPLMPRMKGVQRLFWCKNQVRTAELQDILSAFQCAGQSVIWLEANLLCPSLHRQGCLLLKEHRLQISSEASLTVIAELEKQGWHHQVADPIQTLSLTGRLWLKHDTRLPIVLHSALSSWCIVPDLMTEIKQRATPLNWQGVTNFVWDVTDLWLLRAVEFGYHRSCSSLLAVANAMMLLRDQTVDWSRLAATAEHYRLAAPLQGMIRTLRTLQFDLPPEVQEIEKLSVAPIEQQEYESLAQKQSYLLARGLQRYAQHHRFAMIEGKNSSPYSFLLFLRDSWQLTTVWQIPVWFLCRKLRTTLRTMWFRFQYKTSF